MPEISKELQVFVAWFDENTDESKVIADRETLIFWWKQIIFSPRIPSHIFASAHEGWLFPFARNVDLKQFPGLHGPVWHLRKVLCAPAASRLFLFLILVSLLFLSESPASLYAPCSLFPHFLQCLSPAHVLQQAACLHARIKQPALLLSSCSLLNYPYPYTTYAVNSEQTNRRDTICPSHLPKWFRNICLWS